MANTKNDEKQAEPAPAADPKLAAKKKIFMVGGAVGVLALAFGAALMAVPSKPAPPPHLSGPFVGPVTANKVQVNLVDGRSFLVLELNILYDAYTQDYLTTRNADPVCNAEIRDALVAIASAKSRNDVSDKVNKPIFLEEIRHAVEPFLFPVHLGEAKSSMERDRASGLGLGDSMSKATFRGLYEEHVVKVDAVTRRISIDDGPEVTFRGDEKDLRVTSADDSEVYLDVSALESDFQGQVKIGVKGRARRVLWNEILIQ